MTGTKKFYFQLQVLCNFGYVKEQVHWVFLCANRTHGLFCIQKENLRFFWCHRSKCLRDLWLLVFSETLGESSFPSVLTCQWLLLLLCACFLLCVRDQFHRNWWVHVFCPGNEQFRQWKRSQGYSLASI